MPRLAAGRHSPFYDLLDAVRQPGCALCSLSARTRWRFLDSLAYENVNDIATREKLRVALGFCNRHAWFFVETVREVFGTGIIYRDLLHAVQHRASRARLGGDPFQPNGPCLACVTESNALADAVETLAESLGAPELREALRDPDGLCAPHLRRALVACPTRARETVLQLVGQAWEASADTLPILRTRATGAEGCLGVDERVFEEGAAGATPTAVASTASDTPFRCAVCEAVRADLAGAADLGALDDGAGGICNVHAWQGAESASVADRYRRQIQAARESIDRQAGLDGKPFLTRAFHGLGLRRAGAAARWGPDWLPLPCVVCRHQAGLETTLCAEARGTLCVPHLRRAVALGNRDAISDQRETWRELDSLLGEYIRKEDYRFRAEPRGVEQSAPRWAVALIAGEPGIR